MVVVPLDKPQKNGSEALQVRGNADAHWLRYVAAGTLAAGGALLVTGYRRAGLITAASGAALAMLDQGDVVSEWWNMLPGLLEELQASLGHAQEAVQDLSLQGQKLRQALDR